MCTPDKSLTGAHVKKESNLYTRTVPKCMAKKLKLNVDRMMCEMCVKKVTEALSVPGVSNLDVKIGKVSLTYDENIVRESDLVRAVVDAGFPCTVRKGLF